MSFCNITQVFFAKHWLVSFNFVITVSFFILQSSHLEEFKGLKSYLAECSLLRHDQKLLIWCQLMINHVSNGGYLIRGKNYLPFASTWIHLQFLFATVLLIFLVFCISFLWFSCLCSVSYVPKDEMYLDCQFVINVSIDWKYKTAATAGQSFNIVLL